jgi:hypothetical protein
MPLAEPVHPPPVRIRANLKQPGTEYLIRIIAPDIHPNSLAPSV